MDQTEAREYLDLDWSADRDEIVGAYAKKSRILKRRLVCASSIASKERARRALRNLVAVRDLALGSAEADALRRRRHAERPVLVDDWWSPEVGVPFDLLDQERVLHWFGVRADATPEAIRRVFHARSRKLKRWIAAAKTEYELRTLQDALLRLNELLRAALEVPSGSSLELLAPSPVPPPPAADSGETLTDITLEGRPPPGS